MPQSTFKNNLAGNLGAVPTNNGQSQLDRTPMYLQDGLESLFGWYHTADGVEDKDCVAVICSPIGWEYAHSHRSLRHLADHLAKNGIPALRFDFHGIGDSPGTDADPDRWSCWQSNIKAMVQHARDLSGRKRVCLIGLRLGATLAALVADKIIIDLLVLWNPCINGRRYIRESEAIALTAARQTSDIKSQLESGGFVMTAETIAAIKSVNLLNLMGNSSHKALIIGRDDLSPDQSLAEHLTTAGIENDYFNAPGYAGMMAEAQFTVLPLITFEKIGVWIVAHSKPWLKNHPLTGNTALPSETTFFFRNESGSTATISEQISQFGTDDHLFGILSRPEINRNYPLVILFNAGAVHHVGPNRLYVALARNLAAQGFPCFRFDLEGLGDSIARSAGMENITYPETADADARMALEHLKQHFGYKRFVFLGLCSGAHTSFHAGLNFDQEPIGDMILINPLTFYWVEGMSLDTSIHFQDVSYYRGAMKNPRRWLKLLRGQVHVVKAMRVMLMQFATITKSYLQSFHELLKPEAGTQLSQDLRRLFTMKRQITFFVSESDPGRDILMASAKRTATWGLKKGYIELQIIPDANHTFSQSKPRKDLIFRVSDLLIRRYAQPSK